MATKKEIKAYWKECIRELERFQESPSTNYYSIGDFILNLINSCDLETELEGKLGTQEVNSQLPMSLKIIKVNE